MKYLCLIRAEKVMETMSPAFAAQHFEAYQEFTRSIRASGHYVACNRLLPADSATTIRVRHGSLTVTDGPYVETKEQLGGYFVIEARDLNEAIQVAARIPGASLGSVELRPVADDERTAEALFR
jgi:hypothetical protein